MLSHLEAEFVAVAIAVAATPELAARGAEDARRLADRLLHAASRQTYLNFRDGPTEVRSAFAETAWPQLKGIRSAVDPHGTFLPSHEIPRLWENGRLSP